VKSPKNSGGGGRDKATNQGGLLAFIRPHLKVFPHWEGGGELGPKGSAGFKRRELWSQGRRRVRGRGRGR